MLPTLFFEKYETFCRFKKIELLKTNFSVNQLFFQKFMKIIFFKIISRAKLIVRYQSVIESSAMFHTPSFMGFLEIEANFTCWKKGILACK